MGLPGDLLPNGMPALPADLQLDAPLPAAKQGDIGPKFSAAPASIGGSGFHSGLFTLPNQQSSSMWNQLGQVAGPQPAQQRTSGGLAQAQAERQSSEADAGSKAAWGVPAVSGMNQTPQANLGAFSSGPSSLSAGPPGLQFGQVMSGGFGAFVPTGVYTMLRALLMHVQLHEGPVPPCLNTWQRQFLGMQASNQTGARTLASSRTGAPLPWGSSQTGALDLWAHPWHLHPSQHLLGLLLSDHHPSMVLKALGGELADVLVPARRGLLSLRLMQPSMWQLADGVVFEDVVKSSEHHCAGSLDQCSQMAT